MIQPLRYGQDKQAVGPPYHTTPAQQALVRQEALRQLLGIGSLAVGTGAGLRGLTGLARLFSREPSSPMTAPAPLHVPSLPSDETEERAGLNKAAAPLPAALQPFAGFLPNISTKRPLGDWWGMPAAVSVGTAGVAGGWSLADWLLRKSRQVSNSSDLAAAQAEYDKALADEYATAMRDKRAADALGISSLFDQWAEAAQPPLQKQADLKDTIGSIYTYLYGLPAQWLSGGLLGDSAHDASRGLAGVALTGLGATGVGAGVIGYNLAKSQDRKKLMERALALRARRQQLNRPVSLYAVPDEPYAAAA